MSEQITVEFTSSAVTGENGAAIVKSACRACERYGFEFGIQLHNTADWKQIRKAAAFGVPLSVHAPLMSDYMLNLASRTFVEERRCLDESVRYMREMAAKRSVFHGFTMTDLPIPAFGRGRSYDDCMARIFRPELALSDSRICNDFFATDEFRERLERVRERLVWMTREYPDLTFHIENDFPAYGAANLLSEHAVALNHPVCLDSSHLWTSAFIYGRNFEEETDAFLASGKVGMVHLHASVFTAAVPKGKWSDGHLPLRTPNSMNLPRFVVACRRAGVVNIVLEIVKATEDDIHSFAEMWFAV